MNFEINSLPDNLAHQGIAVLNTADLDEMNILNNSIVRINANRNIFIKIKSSKTVLRGQIYLDATSRLNISSRVGDNVGITPEIKQRNLSKVVFAPVGESFNDIDVIKNIIGKNLLNRYLKRGDHFTTPSPNGGVLELQVEKTGPIGSLKSGGLITIDTEVELLERKAKRPLLQTGDVSFADIGGLDEVIEQLQEVAIIPLLHPQIFLKGGKPPIRGVLLSGEPGTGKSLLARALARETQATFLTISASEIISGVPGETEKKLREIFDDAKKEEPSVIFIDEIDSIAPDRHMSSEGSRRIVSQLLTLMDGVEDRGQVIVIGATNRVDALDPAINRSGRFERVIECNIPNLEARNAILKVHTRAMPLSEDVDIKEVAELIVGFVGADIDHLCREAVYRAANRLFGHNRLVNADIIEVAEMEITREDLLESFSRIRPSIKRRFHSDIKKVDFESIIGQEEAKKVLTEKLMNPLKYGKLYEKAGLSIGSGILLYGPPGTGKTALARAVANVSGAQFISVKGPELLSMWQGESERSVRTLLDKARKMSPCVVFFDEFDSLGMNRSNIGAGHSGLSSVVNQLLTEFDGIDSKDGVLIIAATNRKELIDPAFLREGRLGTQVKVDLPKRNEYVPILISHLKNVSIAKDINLEHSLKNLEDGLSGADIAGIAIKIKETAVSRHIKNNLKEDIESFQIKSEDIQNVCPKTNDIMEIAFANV